MPGTKEAWVKKERRANRANKATRYKVVEGVLPRIKSTTGVHGGRFINLSRVILALTFHGSVHDPFKSFCGDKSNWQIRLSAYTLVALERHIYVSRFT